ncbi:MAG: hypothetical protein AAF512_08715 [Pseudomonadota bacterium]
MRVTQEALNRLATPIHHYVLPIIIESLELCVERHRVAEGKGADNYSFGTDLWSIPARRFKESAGENDFPFTLDSNLGCVLRYGEYRIRHHWVGLSEQDDISRSFPRNANALSFEFEKQNQLALDFGDDIPFNQSGTIVIAIMANATEGLCAVYLAAPRQVINGKITEWDQWIDLWRRDATVPVDIPEAMDIQIEQASEPVVQRHSHYRKP